MRFFILIILSIFIVIKLLNISADNIFDIMNEQTKYAFCLQINKCNFEFLGEKYHYNNIILIVIELINKFKVFSLNVWHDFIKNVIK
jgi:hypothetical protein